MEPCSICLENFDGKNKEKYVLFCNHYFHRSCVNKWLVKHNSCPLCREPISLVMIHLKNKIKKAFKYSWIETNKRKYITLDGEVISDAYSQLINQRPAGFYWVDNIKWPVYLVKGKEKKYKISCYFRQVIISTLVLKKDIFTFEMDREEIFDYKGRLAPKNSNLDIKNFNIMYTWLYEVMTHFKSEKLIRYHHELNSIIMDLVVKKIKQENTVKENFQTIIIASMFVVFQIYDFGKITKEMLIWMTDNSTNSILTEYYIEKQQKLFEKNIKINKKNNFI